MSRNSDTPGPHHVRRVRRGNTPSSPISPPSEENAAETRQLYEDIEFFGGGLSGLRFSVNGDITFDPVRFIREQALEVMYERVRLGRVTPDERNEIDMMLADFNTHYNTHYRVRAGHVESSQFDSFLGDVYPEMECEDDPESSSDEEIDWDADLDPEQIPKLQAEHYDEPDTESEDEGGEEVRWCVDLPLSPDPTSGRILEAGAPYHSVRVDEEEAMHFTTIRSVRRPVRRRRWVTRHSGLRRPRELARCAAELHSPSAPSAPSSRQATANRILLVRGGVEQNPGPCKVVSATVVRGKGRARRVKQQAAIAQSLQESTSRIAGENDALKKKLEDLRHEVAEKDSSIESIQDAHAREIVVLQKTITRARELGYIEPEEDEPLITYAFRGKYGKNMQCTFEDTDPLVTVNIMADGSWWTDAFGEFMQLEITQTQIMIASCTVSCTAPTRRFTNIYNGLVQSREVKEAVARMDSQEALYFAMTMDKRAFVLCGTVTGAGRSRWLNDVPELVPHLFTVDAPPDSDQRLQHKVVWAPNCLAFEASHYRKFRAAPIRIQGETPYIPDATDPKTMKAGLCKRLFPELPMRSPEVLQDLKRYAKQFSDLVNDRAPVSEFVDVLPEEVDLDDPRVDEMHQGVHAVQEENAPRDLRVKIEGNRSYDEWREKLFAKAMEGRPQRERVGITNGFEMARDDPVQAIEYYLSKPYKCFIKLEAYPKGSLKPPRFIMSLDLECRGIQIFFMAGILARIEHGTREGNVKGLTEAEKTQKLIDKFSDGLVGETDFSSFESCIGPDLKANVENHIFRNLAQTPAELDFITRCLNRTTVHVIGPNFSLPNFHHIRMSGDYWTSIGNLAENVCIMAYCLNQPVSWVIKHGLFEGDDGCFPAPRRPQDVIARSIKCGVKLTFDIAPWQSLSFCGNHFEQVDGVPQRFRDKRKALANLSVLFNAPGYTRAHDMMLQRSKALAYLSGPIIPDAFVVAAIIERFSRLHKVNPDVLLRMGLLKEYSAHGVEGCVPEWLVKDAFGTDLSDRQFVEVVYNRNYLAGGECDKSTVKQMVKAMRSADPCDPYVVLPCPYGTEGDMGWYYRDGSRFTHADSVLTYPLLEFNDVRTSPAAALPFGLFAHKHGKPVPPLYEEPWVRKGRSLPVRHPLRAFFWVRVLMLVGVAILTATAYLSGLSAAESLRNRFAVRTVTQTPVPGWMQSPMIPKPRFANRQACYAADLSFIGIRTDHDRIDWCDDFSGAPRLPEPVWKHMARGARYWLSLARQFFHRIDPMTILTPTFHTYMEAWGCDEFESPWTFVLTSAMKNFLAWLGLWATHRVFRRQAWKARLTLSLLIVYIWMIYPYCTVHNIALSKIILRGIVRVLSF